MSNGERDKTNAELFYERIRDEFVEVYEMAERAAKNHDVPVDIKTRVTVGENGTVRYKIWYRTRGVSYAAEEQTYKIGSTPMFPGGESEDDGERSGENG